MTVLTVKAKDCQFLLGRDKDVCHYSVVEMAVTWPISWVP